MGDREDKVAKAREKLEKFRRNKNKEPAAAAASPVDSAPTNSSMKVAADEPAAVSSENTHVSLNQTAALEPEPQKSSSSPQASLPASSTTDQVTVFEAAEPQPDASQSSNLTSYFAPTTADVSVKEGGSLSSYFQSQPSSEASGISDAFASLVSTIPSMDSISTNLVSTIQELVVEEPQEEEEDRVEVEDIEQERESHGEVSSSSVPGPAFYIGSEEGVISSSTNSLPAVQVSESMMAAPSSSSSLMQDAKVAELIYLLEEEKRGREEEKRGREAEMIGREEERRGREAVEAEKVNLQEELVGERKRLEEGAGLELQRLQGELAARSASIQLVVAERSDLEAALVEARRRAEVAEGELTGLRDRAERAEEEVVRQEERLRTEGGAAQHMQEVNEKREGEVALLRKEAEVREEESKEVHAKLSMVGSITLLY